MKNRIKDCLYFCIILKNSEIFFKHFATGQFAKYKPFSSEECELCMNEIKFLTLKQSVPLQSFTFDSCF